LLFALTHAAQSSTVEFAPAVISPVAGGPMQLVLGDFSGDGKPDLAVVSPRTSTTSILLGNGDGTFHAKPNLDVIGAIAAGDFDGDQKVDLVADDGSSLSLYLSQGDGTFRRPIRIAGGGQSSLLAADINQDGRLDILNGSTVLLGNGDGTFKPAQDIGAPVTLIDDFNEDGHPDVIASGGVMLGNGDGTFQRPIPIPWPAPCGFFCRRSGSNLVSGDFDGDGHLDLAEGLINESCPMGCQIVSASILLFFGNGDGSFRASSLSATTDFLPQFLMAADFNQDGKTDLAVAPTVEHGSSLISFYLSGPQGPLSDRASYDIGSGPISLVATDLNGDGSPDIVSADFTDATISVALNLPPDFTMSVAHPSLSVQRGGQVSEKLAIGSQTGFAGTVALTCTVHGPAPIPTCSLTPGSVLAGGTAQLNISTSAAQASFIATHLYGLLGDLALLFPVLSGCVFLARLNKPAGVWLFPMIAATIFLVSCGGNSNISPPPIQNYTITVTGTSGTLHHSATVALTVQ